MNKRDEVMWDLVVKGGIILGLVSLGFALGWSP